MLDWKFYNVVINKRTVERHYKCQNTGAWMCKEFKKGGGLKEVSFALPSSDDYNIKSEETLLNVL